jgi:hypothetical protein
MQDQASHSPATIAEPVNVTVQLRAVLAEQGRRFYRWQVDGMLLWVVDGEALAPWQAANAFLPGGWAAAWRRSQGLV